MQIRQQFPSPVFGPTGIVQVDGSLWLSNDAFMFGSGLVEYDLSSSTIRSGFPFTHGEPLGLDYDGTNLWVVGAIPGRSGGIYCYSTETGAELRAFDAPGPQPYGVAWDGIVLWHTDAGTDLLYKLNTERGQVEEQYEIPLASVGGLAFDPARRTFWMTDDSERIYEMALPGGLTHLARFSALAGDSSIAVAWIPTRSSHQQRFVLRRHSSGNDDLAMIASLDGALAQYSIEDRAVERGNIYYYDLVAESLGSPNKVFGPLSVAFHFSYSTPGPAPMAQIEAVGAPNPFRTQTTILCRAPATSSVVQQIFDVRGRLVRALAESVPPNGSVAVVWDGSDSHGVRVASGSYYCRISGTSARARMLRLTLIR